MSTPRDWKSEEILKLAGSVVREGIFQGHPGEDTNNPHARKPSKFTPEIIEKAFQNISGPIPIFMKHDMKGQPRDQIGSTFHAGITPAKDDIEVRGMVWKRDAINRINNEKLNRFSPEFDIDYDVQGNIMNARIIGLIPTNSPAISNPPITAVPSVFESIGGSMTGEATPAVPPTGTPQAAAAAHAIQTTIAQPAPGYTIPPVAPALDINADVLKQMNAFATQMASNQDVIKKLVAENEAMKSGSINTLIAEVKALGVSDPLAMLTGLPADSQITVLKTIKESLALRAPLVSPGGAGQNTSTPTQTDVENSILKEIGISRKEYDKLMASPCPSLVKEE